MFCPNCGANIPEDSGVCPDCNTEIFIARKSGGRDRDPFIVAEDGDDEQTPGGQNEGRQGEGGPVSGSPIIEAEEEPVEEGEPDVPGVSAGVVGLRTALPEEYSVAEPGEGHGRDDIVHDTSYAENPDFSVEDALGTEMEEPETHVPIPDVHAPQHPSSDTPSPNSPADEPVRESRGAKPPTSARLSPPPSRRRPVTAGLAVTLLVVLGVALLVYGLPGGDDEETDVVIPTPLPTIIPETTPVPVTETAPPWTPSENLILSITSYGSGYKVEIENGLLANEVEMIVLAVEDSGGEHTMEWVYPSRHETFFMSRDAYNGTVSATEYVTATATYSDGKKEVVFSGNL